MHACVICSRPPAVPPALFSSDPRRMRCSISVTSFGTRYSVFRWSMKRSSTPCWSSTGTPWLRRSSSWPSAKRVNIDRHMSIVSVSVFTLTCGLTLTCGVGLTTPAAAGTVTSTSAGSRRPAQEVTCWTRETEWWSGARPITYESAAVAASIIRPYSQRCRAVQSANGASRASFRGHITATSVSKPKASAP